MTAELYVTKAALQISKSEFDNAVKSMEKAIEIDDDIASVVQARCFLGEYYFVNQNYDLSKENLEWIVERQEKFEADYDDLLNDEVDKAYMLLEMMEKFGLGK